MLSIPVFPGSIMKMSDRPIYEWPKGERGSKIAASKITAKYIETCVGADVADLAKVSTYLLSNADPRSLYQN